MKQSTTKPLLSHWEWQAGASCRGMDSSVFFSPAHERGTARRKRESRARSVCRDCPVQIACAAFAVRTGQAYGVWGGLTEADRDTTRSASGPDLPPAPRTKTAP
ncbi:WhiB family transcriptional regulator [Streptacidiphilus fuscans]|uniref:Transcriptional regulator WhiB n=1 Tax=Streptacidiphilus fuscans TaxID=2789292 RepID=A0A931B105_9ACTN|nr:WhiB family transcriptional regulator [Streptacidiphilus fuscans]MBF9066702.1 WhiB family transcriptional regulator [Streptacidiphilus fuscans]